MPKGKYLKRGKRGGYIKKQVGKNKADLKILKRSIERKFNSRIDQTIVMDNTPTLYYLNHDIIQTLAVVGQPVTTQHSRDGDALNGKSIMIRGYFDNKGVAPNNNTVDCICRFILYRIKKNRGQTPVFSRLVNNPDSVNTLRNVDRASAFDVMYDQTFAMDTTQMSLIPFKLRKKINTITTYDDNAGDVNGVQDNLYVIAVYSTVDDNEGVLDSPDFHFDIRYSYTDM